MKRETLFRGKRLDNGEWIEGFYSCRMGKDYITHIHCVIPSHQDTGGEYFENTQEVAPESVGEFIGRFCDKTGEKIFNGMVVEFSEPSSIYPADRAKRIGIISFADCSFVIEDKNGFRHYRWMDYHVEILNQPKG